MNVRLRVKHQNKRDLRLSGLNGLVLFENSQPVGSVEIQTRRNKTSKWETVEVVHETA